MGDSPHDRTVGGMRSNELQNNTVCAWNEEFRETITFLQATDEDYTHEHPFDAAHRGAASWAVFSSI